MPNPFTARFEKVFQSVLWAYIALAVVITIARNV